MFRTDRLSRRSPAELAALLRLRPDVLVGRPPRTLAELAQRLDSAPSASAAVDQLNAPQFQVMVAACVLSGSSRQRLAEFLHGDPSEQLAALEERDLLWCEGELVHVDRAVQHAVPDVLQLGPSFAQLAEIFPHRILERAVRGLELPRTTTKHAAVTALAAFYADPDRIRAHALELPPDILDALVDPPDPDELLAHGPGPDWYRDSLVVTRAALAAGLMLGEDEMWGNRAVMPAEVRLALHGPNAGIRFDPEPPAVSWLPVSRVAADAAAALARFDAASTAVLDHVAATTLPTVQAGGVGRRELQKLAKATSEDVVVVTVVLELAAAAGLLGGARPVRVSEEFAAWRDAEPTDRVVALLEAWWAFPGRPGEQRDGDGNARRVFVAHRCHACREARHVMVSLLREDAGLSDDDLVALAGWTAPGADAGDPPWEGHRFEATLLGATAQGAVTPVGAALRAGDRAALREAVAAALPASSATATFGSDLTAYVAGSPAASVSRLLDSCATRESGGGAVTWRLSAASVRRALDDGASLEVVRSELRAIASGGALPSAVEVLLDDVGRVWGRARVRDAGGVVVSEDEALLVQMQHDRKLAKLGLQQIAPTVLLASADGRSVVTALRAAGYLPAWDGEDDSTTTPGPVVVRRPPAPRPALGPSVDPDELAHRLLDPSIPAPEPTATELAVEQFAPHLSGDMAAVLAAAIDDKGPVEIVYESSSGGITERVIRPEMVVGSRVWAWCELRSAQREFVVDRILAVRPVAV